MTRIHTILLRVSRSVTIPWARPSAAAYRPGLSAMTLAEETQVRNAIDTPKGKSSTATSSQPARRATASQLRQHRDIAT